MNLKRFLIIASTFAVFMITSCKKEDTNPPALTIQAPVEAQNLSYMDVKANYGDYYLETAEMTIVKHETREQIARIFNKYGADSFDSETAGEFNVGYKASDLGISSATAIDVNFKITDAYDNVTQQTVHCTVTP